MKPNLFIVGAPRCGTTAWLHYLQSHPDIFFSEVKEPHYFSPDLPPTQRHIQTLDEYLRLFEDTGSAKIVGEASVRSLYSKVAARNIQAFNPDAKIIIFVRDQPDYLRSRHNEMLYAGLEDVKNFEQAWRESVAGPRESLSGRCSNLALLDYASWGRFYEQSQRYYAQFSDEQVRVFSFSSWVSAPRTTYLEILRFLGVQDDGRTEFPVVNEAREPRSNVVMDFLRSPPSIVSTVADQVKKVTGQSGLGIGKFLHRLSSRSGSASDISDELKAEIRRYYAGENDRLEPRVWRPEKSERRSPEPEVAVAKPNLFIVGAPKCGTTAWYEYLREHPDIFFPDVKEPSHFLTDFPKWPQVSDRAEYLRLFDESGDGRIIGEASPHYLYSEEAARNIRKFNPDAKIIILVRDRADYLQSLYNEHLFNGVETIKDFKVAWELSGRRNSENTWEYCKEPGLLDYRKSAEFSPQVERFFDAFPAEQIRVFRFQDWTRSPRQTYLEILKFLGVEDDGRDTFEVVNEAHHHGAEFLMKFVKMPPAPVRKLVGFLRKLAGREGLGVGSLALRMSRRQGRLIEVDPALKAAIRKQYEQDDELLERHVSPIPCPDRAERAA